MSYSISIGPYIKAKPIYIDQTSQVEYKVCSNDKCPESRYKAYSGQFCSECASPLIKQFQSSTKQIRKVTPYDLFDDDLIEISSESSGSIDDNFDYFIPNKKWGSERRNIIDSDDVFVFDISELNPEKDIKIFSEYYVNQIKLIEENYTDVTISWGIINFYL